jgi:hypothetical protein
MNEHDPRQPTEFRARDRELLFAFVAGPVAVLTNLTISYMLVPESCERQSKLILHLTTAVFLVVIAGAFALARSIHRRFTAAEAKLILWQERTEWMARSAMILGVASMIVLVAMEIPNLILRSCD